ncbi:MAG: D-aminoacylase [Pseudomonadales bacterium]|nr:D-aminoacylase [Pseudomonadales bacterium]MBO6703927.1 D-aminoacylase [Pseudomonadales bacterium]MBO7006988.1 D-aminoacylase [Pseudomonadales bacterium]
MTHYDLIIRNGKIVDGTGAAAYNGDVAVKDGMIAAVGSVIGKASQEIDAEGQVVSPGFVDIHTHLDAQMGWDPDMTPVSWHGVTTALIGNCGMTFAPCKPEHRELLAGMMETVEDIPKDAILGGLAWDWEQYGEYLDSIERLGTAINVAGLVGHAAVRYYVMGDRSFSDDATAEEKAQMSALVEKAMSAGAFGFSTNRYEPHKAPDGRSIPGTFADVSELEEIASVVSKRDGLMQAVGADFECLHKIASIDNSRVLFSYGTGPNAGDGKMAAKHLDKLADGRDVTAISHVRGSGYMFGLQSGLPFRGATWHKLREMNFDDRLAALGDDSLVAELVEEARAVKGSYVPMESVFFLGADATPDYANDENMLQLAERKGEHFGETFIRLSKETGGRALFNFRMFATSLEQQAALFKSDNIYPGLGDAGAHVSQIMDAGWSSFILSYWTRDRGEFTLEEAVRKMTSGPARVIGLDDRGVLAEGMRADINVFDPGEVAEMQPVLVNDFPGGAPRYIQKAKGFKATIVNGQVSLVNDALTGVRAGKVLRHAS